MCVCVCARARVCACGEPKANLNFAHLSNVTVHVSSEIFIKPGKLLNAIDLDPVCTLRHGQTVSSPLVTIRTATFNIHKFLRSAHTVYLVVLCGSENKQRLFPYTALTDWFL